MIPNHPNRSRRGGHLTEPSAEMVTHLRSVAGWTQAQAAQVLRVCIRTYQRWEDADDTNMAANVWDLMKIRASEQTGRCFMDNLSGEEECRSQPVWEIK